MRDEDLKKLDYAFAYYRNVFNRHFKSLGEAKEVEERALKGDDRAMVKLWRMYQDGIIENYGYEAIVGKGASRRETRYNAKIINYDVAEAFRKRAKDAGNPEAISFGESVRLGNRNPMAHYEVYSNVGEDSYINPVQATNPHPRYLADLLWYERDKGSSGGIRFSYKRPVNSSEILGGNHVAYLSKNTSDEEFISLYKRVYDSAIKALKVCASAGNIDAATELKEIHATQYVSYYKDTFFGSEKLLETPYYDLGESNHWAKMEQFLLGKGDNKQLDKFIKDQDSTATGLFNIGVALCENPHVRTLYNKRMGRPLNDFTAAHDFIKHAANLGNASAAWYYADMIEAEEASSLSMYLGSGKQNLAALWYKTASELGHPNAKHRYNYLLKQKNTIIPEKLESWMVNPSQGHIELYPSSLGSINVGQYDYSFLRDSKEGDIRTRIDRARKLSEKQVREFDVLIKGLEARIEIMLQEANSNLDNINDIDRQRDAGFATNTRVTKNIGEVRRKIKLSKDRWCKEHAAYAATGLAAAIITGGKSVVASELLKSMNPARAAGFKAAAQNEQEYLEEQIGNFTVQLVDVGLLDEQQKELQKEVERIMGLKSIIALRKDKVAANRLFQGYLRQQVLEMADQGSEYLDKYARQGGFASVDALLEAFTNEVNKTAAGSASEEITSPPDPALELAKKIKSRAIANIKAASKGKDIPPDAIRSVHLALQNFCFGVADTNDLHIMLAYSDAVGNQPQTGRSSHNQALHQFVENHIKPSIDDYISKSNRMDVLKEAQFKLAPVQGDELTIATHRNNAELGALMQANFASEGTHDVNLIFDFYLHRHGTERTLYPTRINDGMIKYHTIEGEDRMREEEKRVKKVWTPDERDDFIERTIHSYKNSSVNLPPVESIFLRVCAAEYFEPQSVKTAGMGSTFKDNPQAPVAYPMANDVIHSFIERMSLSPIGKYRNAMEDKRALDSLVAQSFIDFFAVVGQAHAAKFEKERDDLKRAYDLKAYGTRFRDCYRSITDDVLERYDTFKEIFAFNLQRTLETATLNASAELLAQLEEVKKMGARGLDPENIIIPGTSQALDSAIKGNRRFQNMRPPFMDKNTGRE